MFIAFSVLAISLSFLLYRHPLSKWRAFLLPPPGPASSAKSVGTSHDAAEKQQADAHVHVEVETEDTSNRTPSPPTTPKAIPTGGQTGIAIPTFSLAAHESPGEDEDDLPPPSFPAMNSAQRASAQPTLSVARPGPPAASLMAPPPRPTSLMAPPPRIVPSNLRALPTTGPLPNRGPVPNRGTPSSNGSLAPQLSAKAPTSTPNTRGKVLLPPGHSPLDWANLQKSGKNLSGVPSLMRVTPTMLKHHNGRKGKPAWSSYQGKVYNISPYLPFHPGGEGELRRAAGKDGGKLFMEVHPWVNWENMLGECLVGIMVSEDQTSSLEDMD